MTVSKEFLMPSIPSAIALAAAGLLLAGCASTAVDAQWRSTELPPGYLRGATVLVACETGEIVIKRICEDRVVADLGARGVRAVLATSSDTAVAPTGASDMQLVPAARSNGARALYSDGVGLASQSVSPGFTIGIGGFGFGRHSAGGIGVSAPFGGGQVSQGYAANGRVTDVASGRLMWTARASAPPSSDINNQLAELSRSVLDAAAGAGLF
jgi:hypothetical protein